MDHDRLFKELLALFFIEFVDLFLPQIGAALDCEFGVVPLDKEIFTDVTHGESYEVDLLMRARFQGQEAFFLIHVENQSTPQSDFPKRMFRYFARLTEKYDAPVFPVVVFSYDSPRKAAPSRWEVAFPGKKVLQFDYAVIQLNRLPWRRFVTQKNPVASALMAKMKMTPKERPRVKLECLRLLASLKLDPARTRLIGGFVESYLRLSAQEMRQYEREFAALTPEERKATMEVLTYWEERGLERGLSQGLSQGIGQGLVQGKEQLVFRQLRRRLGALPTGVETRLGGLSPAQLDDLGEALLDFDSLDDLDAWLGAH